MRKSQMRFTFIIPAFLFFTNICISQNLIPNPSFEDTISCPTGLGELRFCNMWQNSEHTPDYWNACSPTGTNVPNSTFGFQYAHTGSGMIGLGIYREPNSPDGPNWREFAGCELTSGTIVNTKYYLSFFVNYSHYHPFQAVASNNVGMRLSTVSFDSCCSHPPLTNFAHLNMNQILIDSVNWTKVSDSFIADSEYTFLSIGNFFDDAHTDTINLSDFPDGSYYYLDDVCLSTDSLYNETWTGIETPFYSSIQIIPNPSASEFLISAYQLISTILIYDHLGQLVFSATPNTRQKIISLKGNSEGIYYVKIMTFSKSFTKTIVLTN